MKSFCASTILLACLFAYPAVSTAQGGAPILASGPAARILEQASWGPTQASIAELQAEGLPNWLNQQFNATPSTIPDLPAPSFPNLSTNQNMAPLVENFFMNAVWGPDQLRQRVAFALSEIWVVSEVNVGNASAFPPLLRIFRDRAFDNYENLMRDLTLNPAMGQYLNLANNIKAGRTGGSPNENYARELLQLFSVGPDQLNPDGSPVLDANGNPVEAYDQATVTGLARALTGWTYSSKLGVALRGQNSPYYLGQMIPVEANHDTQQKTLFGTVTLPAGQSASDDRTQALHAIFMQPSLPPFISRQLIQHLVTSNPSAAYVERVASVFADNGSGVRGDLKTVVTAILTDPEARAGDDPSSTGSPSFGHLREPVLLEANLLRSLGLAEPDGNSLLSTLDAMGQKLFYSPAVTSYFLPSYRTADNLPAPEFQILSTQTAANRLNTIDVAVARSSIAHSGASTPAPASSSPASPVTVNIVTLGAKNDRSADASGVINNAIQMAGNGGTVIVPAGTYSIRGMIFMTQNGVTLQCQSGAKLIADAGLPDMIWINASNDLVEGCLLDGNKAVNGSNGIGVDGSYPTVNGKTTVTLASNNRITGCTIQNFSGTNIYADAVQTLEVDHNTITDGGGGDPIGMSDNLYNISVHNNTITTSYALSGGGAHGIGIHSTPSINGPVQNIQVYENTIYQGAGNFCIEILGQVGGQLIQNVSVHDNRCTFAPGAPAINGMDSLGGVQGGTVQHEILNANGQRIGIDFIELAGNTNNVTVDSNLLFNAAVDNSGAIDINGGSNDTISNNLLLGSGAIYIGATGNSGTGVPCSNNIVKNNVVLMSRGITGFVRGVVWIQANFESDLFNGNGHFDNNQILDNYLVGVTAGPVQMGVGLENDYSTWGTNPTTLSGTVITGNHIYGAWYGIGDITTPTTSITNTLSTDNIMGPGVVPHYVIGIGVNSTSSGDTQDTASFDPSVIIPMLNASFFNSSMSAGLQQTLKLAMNSMPDAIDKANAAVDVALSSGEHQVIEQAVMSNTSGGTAPMDTQIQTINTLFFHGSMSANLTDAVTQAFNGAQAAADKTHAALYVALTSGEFQVIH
ncbi:MAG TPA: DUF1800 family protein [Bryobacteraceae bacterium]|nr:DUF1800 family protein [Bryobacteraceae bacterium]